MTSGGAACLLMAWWSLTDLRTVGRWSEVYRWRKEASLKPEVNRWKDLKPVQRGWFYQVPIFGLAGIVLIISGLSW